MSNKMRLYKRHEFCRDINCRSIYNDRCARRAQTGNACEYTAKEFHEWLEENEFEIRKRRPNQYRCMHCRAKMRKMEPHICGGVMRIHDLKFRHLKNQTLHTLKVTKVGV